MEKRKENFINWLTGGGNINYTFNPKDNSIMKIAWKSPGDGKENMINFLLDWEPYTIKVKDNH